MRKRYWLDDLKGYKLWLSWKPPEWRQLAFADLVPTFPVSLDPIRTMQYGRIIEEIVGLKCKNGLMFSAYGWSHRDNGGGIIISLGDENIEEAGILFSPPQENRADIVFNDVKRIVLLMEELGGFVTYDPQLGRIIDIRADMDEMKAACRKLTS